ncbi:MAG: type II toxin-antitoxin system prevent-host-death family antitoxin [Myxococcales bacterium]|nr:type II toxin-antitoxin system prevent-host-death family antitoxin [Myxococcales bacterium]
MQVNILEARNQLSQLIKSALAGETVVIANRGVPVIQLVPIDQSSQKAKRGSAEAILSCLDALGPAHAHRSTDELEAAIQAERTAWD